MTLQAALAYTATMAATIPGIKAAPEQPTENIGAYPYVLTYPAGGVLVWEPGIVTKGLHTIVCEIVFNRSILPKAVETAVPYIKLFADKLKEDPTLGGTVDTVIAEEKNRIEYDIKFKEYNRVVAMSIEYRFVVKIRE